MAEKDGTVEAVFTKPQAPSKFRANHYTINPRMKGTSLFTHIRHEVRPEQKHDIEIVGTNVKILYTTLGYHYKNPRSVQVTMKELKIIGGALFIILFIDRPDTNRQIVQIQKTALDYSYNLVWADSVEDCRQCLDEIRYTYQYEGKSKSNDTKTEVIKMNSQNTRFYGDAV